MDEQILIEFNKKIMKLKPFIYNNGRIGILMMELETNNFHGSLTVNMSCNISNDEILLKDYNEFNGIYKCLLENNIINPVRRKMTLGLNELHVCEVTKEFKSKIKY